MMIDFLKPRPEQKYSMESANGLYDHDFLPEPYILQEDLCVVKFPLFLRICQSENPSKIPSQPPSWGQKFILVAHWKPRRSRRGGMRPPSLNKGIGWFKVFFVASCIVD